jgi:hypothetical protein
MDGVPSHTMTEGVWRAPTMTDTRGTPSANHARLYGFRMRSVSP